MKKKKEVASASAQAVAPFLDTGETPLTVRVTVLMDREMRDALEAERKKSGMVLSEIMRRAFAAYCEKQK